MILYYIILLLLWRSIVVAVEINASHTHLGAKSFVPRPPGRKVVVPGASPTPTRVILSYININIFLYYFIIIYDCKR